MVEPNRLAAMTFSYPESIPVKVAILPAAWMRHQDDLQAIVSQYPGIFGEGAAGERDYMAVSGTYVAGEHVDAWGCVWSNLRTGMEAIVTKHSVPTRADVHILQAPEVDTGFPHGLMYLRLCDLRGFEELMLDFADEPPELQMLIDIVFEYNMDQLDKRLAGLEAGKRHLLYFGDDLGMQTSIPMSPETWRKYLKPCYARIYGRCRDAGHWVYMHSDGHILGIIPDLIECGVNVINPQVRANGLDNLASLCHSKVCVDLDLDRRMLPFAAPKEIDAHVAEVVTKLGSPEGGLWLTAEIGPDVPLVNIRAMCDALEKHRWHFSR
jgi:uroporphyrinogen decarboxylase